jgi:hypothetical protein
MLLVSIPAVSKLSGLELSEPLIAQQGLDFRASTQAQPDGPQVWLIVQFEGEEGAALPLFGYERHHPLYPFWFAWKLEGVAVLEFLQLLVRGHERLHDLASRFQILSGEQAGQWNCLYFLLHISIGHDKHLFLFSRVYACMRGNATCAPSKTSVQFQVNLKSRGEKHEFGRFNADHW